MDIGSKNSVQIGFLGASGKSATPKQKKQNKGELNMKHYYIIDVNAGHESQTEINADCDSEAKFKANWEWEHRSEEEKSNCTEFFVVKAETYVDNYGDEMILWDTAETIHVVKWMGE